MTLPIEAALPELREALRGSSSAVLQAPPGAGKTTRVPLALLGERWLQGRTIVMLEPRRLAARAAAHFMARQLGERVGETVGYRVRLDTRVGPRTRIEVVTEGVLTRLLLADPALETVGFVIFDEFHERSLPGDTGLALTLQTRELLRPELRLLVMSATLDGQAVARLLGDAPVITSEGKSYPVETHWRARRPDERVEQAMASAVREVLSHEAGDVLAFLPGQGEIHRTAALLDAATLPSGARLHPLFGAMSTAAQDNAIAPSAAGARKVVLATSIAETSLTIDGVRVVVDSGLARVPRFSPASGMTRLETVRVSRASADQRRGRAGRVAPGICVRLWAQEEDAHLLPHAPPEMLEADLAPLALELAEAGVRDPAELRWLTEPPAAAYGQARELLVELGALDGDGRITVHGRRMAALATHPRLAHMLLRGVALGHGGVACRLAALLSERDLMRAERGMPTDADLRLRLELLEDRAALAGSGYARGMVVDRDALRRVREQARQWERQIGVGGRSSPVGESGAAGLLLAHAYPDRIGQRRDGSVGRYLLRNGRGAHFGEPQPLATSAYLVAAELDGHQRDARIYLAAPVEESELLEHFGEQVERSDVVEWDDEAELVRARRVDRLGALVIREAPLREPDPDAVTRALLDVVRRRGLGALSWSRHAAQLRDRLRFLHALDASWPDVSDPALFGSLDAWLGPALGGVKRWEGVQRVDLAAALLALLSWEQRARVDELAPTHCTVPTGSRIAVDYGDPESPVLAVRLQELFGLAETPRVGGGRVPLTLHLLSPAHRPVQVTRDLAGFWRTSYFDVRKDLRGRYPKHYWPDDPLLAEPTRRAKRR